MAVKGVIDQNRNSTQTGSRLSSGHQQPVHPYASAAGGYDREDTNNYRNGVLPQPPAVEMLGTGRQRTSGVAGSGTKGGRQERERQRDEDEGTGKKGFSLAKFLTCRCS